MNTGNVYIYQLFVHASFMNILSSKAPLPVPPTINYEFSHRALASLFHTSPEQFLKLLDRDGNLFLRFYWNEAAKKLGYKSQNPPFGLNYSIKDPTKSMKIALVNMPDPVETGDSYTIALVYRPSRVMMFGFIQDKTALFLLEKTQTDGPDNPVISRISRRLEREEQRACPSAPKEEFYNKVIEILEQEN